MNNKTRFKAGLAFGISMSIFYILQNLLFTSNYTSTNITKAIVVGSITGALSGVLFGWLIGWFANSKFVTNSSKIQTGEGEQILFDTAANHYKGMEAVGGKLYLTNSRLVFKSHKFNIQRHELSIDLKDIKEVSRYKNLGIVNNGLSVITSDNLTEKFIVNEAEEWVSRLQQNQSLVNN